MKCSNCGENLPEGAKFCTNCGAKAEAQPVVEIPTVVEIPAETQTSGVYSEHTAPAPNYSVYQEPVKQESNKGGFAIASLVLSLISLIPCCFPVLQILGLIFGIIGIKSDKKGLSIAGIIISVISAIISLILLVLYGAIVAASINEGYFEEIPYFYN